MFDARLRPLIDPPLNRSARFLASRGVGANGLTVIGFAIGLIGCGAIAAQRYETGLVFVVLNRLLDGLDGAVARVVGPTAVGGFLDTIADTIFYSAVPFAVAVGRPEVALPAAFLIFSFVGTGGSFLAFAAVAGQRQLTTTRHGRKSFFYSTGLMEGAETILAFVLICLWPDRFELIAWVFGGLCWVTTGVRVAVGVVTFRRSEALT